jgi:pimeloyl-ACP methyl ester carboxylesterase
MNKKTLIIGLLFVIGFASCQKEKITISSNANDTFFVENKGHAMKVQVKGNTASKIVVLVVHGGPAQGTDAYKAMPEFQEILEKKYGVAYWEQRLTDITAQGNSEGDAKLKTYGDDMKGVVLSLKKRYGDDTKIFIMGHSWGGMVTSQFMTDGTNQNLVNGWIFADAVYDWNQSDKDGVVFINQMADKQIALGKNVDKWNAIKDKANAYDLSATFSNENYFVFQSNIFDASLIFYEEDYGKIELPTGTPLSTFSHLKYYLTTDFYGIYQAQNIDYTERLIIDARKQTLGLKIPSITKPVFVVTGEKDFFVSPIHAKRFYDLLPAGKKEFLELPLSYHFFEAQELFVNSMVDFIEKYK